MRLNKMIGVIGSVMLLWLLLFVLPEEAVAQTGHGQAIAGTTRSTAILALLALPLLGMALQLSDKSLSLSFRRRAAAYIAELQEYDRERRKQAVAV